VTLLLVDGTNLLHALRRRAGAEAATEGGQVTGALPAGAAVIGRLRGAIPPAVTIELVFDGPPERAASRSVASGVTVSYAGRRSADAVIVERAELAAFERSSGTGADPGDSGVLVVSDDAELRREARSTGAGTARTAWLLARLQRARLSSPSVGRPRAGAAATAADLDADDRPRWRSGRGATRKTGNPKRQPRRGRASNGSS
jgi:hypothetical protein